MNILHPIPNTCPSDLYSTAGAATELANPVIGTNVPAPAYFANFEYKPRPVANALKNINVIKLYNFASSLLAPK